MNVSAALVALGPPPVVAVTSTLPADPAGDVANTVESFCTDTFVAAVLPEIDDRRTRQTRARDRHRSTAHRRTRTRTHTTSPSASAAEAVAAVNPGS